MSVSFSRPDPSSPASVADAVFGTGRRGFDQSEVRDFLRMVAAELGRLQERERFLERELRSAQSNPDLSSAALDDEALTRLLGEETARVLQTARESANAIRDKAEAAAGRILSEAGDEARRLREEAEVESARRRADAAADAEAELDMAKQQGREMVNEARAYRERVLSELARRRELAREQIEQLIHGRDRLMQAFERARLVAVEVVAEMQPLGEPDEYVNLEPTTGPVPVMVANSARPDPGATAGSAAAAGRRAAGGAPPAVTETGADAESDLDADPDAESDSETAAPADADGAGAGAARNERETSGDGPDAGAAGSDAGPDPGTLDQGADPGTDDEASASPEAAPERAGDGSDDVVVDLFARIRADADAVAAARPRPTDPTTDDASDDASDDVSDEASDIVSDAPGDDVRNDARNDASGSAETAAAEADPSPFEERDEELTPLIVASAKKLKRVLADEQNGVLDALRRHHPVRDLDELLPPPDEHAARYGDAIAEELLRAAKAGARSATGSVRLPKAAANEAVGVARGGLDQWLVAPLRDRLQRCVSEGDGDNEVITKKVRAAYREWKTKRIDEQLDDVLVSAHGRGVLGAVKAGTPLRWGVDERVGACADCDDNALAGTVAAGDPFPTGDAFAPAHPGCRCLLLPVDR